MFAHAYCILLVATLAIAAKDVGRVIDSLLANYDKRIRPDVNDKPVDVQVEVAVLDVYNFDELTHQVTLAMYYREKWTDRRLAFDYNDVNQTKHFTLDAEQAKKIWIPDTFIANERSVVKHGFYTPNEFTRVYFNGNITRSIKFTVTVGCSLYLRWFPFDQNVCSLDFESYGHGMDDIKYSWARDSNNNPKIWISKETGQSVRHEITAFRGTDHRIVLETTGKYSRTALELYFKRLSFRYVLDVYFPATAIPVVAFISLCVGPLHFRVLLSTICMAMMVVYSAILMLLTPKVDYKTALDFYVFNSSVTVFNIVLVNYLMYYLLKPKPSPTQIRMRQLNGSNEEGKGILSEEDVEESPTAESSGGQQRFPSKTTELLYKLCEKSYLTMPIFFLIFNIIYWPVVLIASSGTPEDFIPIENRST